MSPATPPSPLRDTRSPHGVHTTWTCGTRQTTGHISTHRGA